MTTCLVRGCGDVGSAVAHILFTSGHRVLVHDGPTPAHLRRGMSFVDGFFSGTVRLERVVGKKARDLDDLPPMARCRRAIPLFTGDLDEAIRCMRAEFVIDARMRKRTTPEKGRTGDYRTIGLGPNFVAGGNVDIAVETAWGESLGKVITNGPTLKLEGEPRPIDGAGRERNVYAHGPGEFRTSHRIGQRVKQGEVVAVLAERFITAPLSGCIRGLTHSGVNVEAGTKIVEIDPRSEPATCFGIGERPERIALGVLQAVDG
jgi:xanthine dehydrogenase accessory factor